MNKISVIGPSKYIGRHFKTIENQLGASFFYFEKYQPNKIIEENPDLVIVPDEHWCELGNIVATCKKHGILTLQLMDGILEWRRTWDYESNGHRVDGVLNPINQPAFANKIACLGYKDYRILESWGNRGKCEIVGMPRLKYIENIRHDFSHLKVKKGKILVCTAKTPAFTKEQEIITIESLKNLRDFFRERNDIEIIWRLSGDLSKKLNIQNTLTDLNGHEIHEIIQEVDAVITTPSTTLLEAMVLKSPVALLDYHNTPHYFESAWVISSQNHISNVVEELINPPIVKLDYQEFLLNEQLFQHEDATGRLIKLIEGMIQNKNNRKNLPDSILDNSYAPMLQIKSDIGTYYSELSWLEKMDKRQLELQLSAAHGTIEILEDKLINIERRFNSIPFYTFLKKIKNRIPFL
ncbi:hypothetical protein [Ancylomarina sp.]|uniref:hypothetical protein n=1 Tax=Ancylomarina sp. TaxID=1970196 RepID=UPI003561776F